MRVGCTGNVGVGVGSSVLSPLAKELSAIRRVRVALGDGVGVGTSVLRPLSTTL